jgi:protein transport protein HofQ
MHEISGMNIVVAPDVRGRVTAIMRDVPWEQALDAVLKTSGFISVRDDNILRVMTVEGSRRELLQREGLEQAQKTATPLQVCTFRLNNAEAGDAAHMLQPFLSPRGRIIADARTNTLIVSDTPQVLQTLGITPVSPSRGRCFSATGTTAQ